nr:MAG TPA: hypothetical protein [Bacteriophage sp.]
MHWQLLLAFCSLLIRRVSLQLLLHPSFAT